METKSFLEEDIGHSDVTTESLGLEGVSAVGVIRSKAAGTLAGLDEARAIFENLGLQTASELKDGDRIKKGTEVLRVEGAARAILAGERVALNFLMRMSGIATLTNRIVCKCRRVNPKVRIAGTRKTTPGFRHYEKKAIRVGGGDPHRYRLDDAILIKDNHIRVVGDVAEAIRRAKASGSFSKKLEVEVSSERDAIVAAREGADIIMLDNMNPSAVARIWKAIKAHDEKIIVEVSGGITEKNVLRYVKFADVISIGALTHSAKAIDFTMEISPNPKFARRVKF